MIRSEYIEKIGKAFAVILMGGVCLLIFSLVNASDEMLPAGETVGQWVWMNQNSLCGAGCIVMALLFRKRTLNFALCVSWSLMVWGAIEAFIGLRQLYGFESSRHSLYALTGSFFNPGPYSGYLAMVLPISLHQWLDSKDEGWRCRLRNIFSGGAMLLILCVLPAGMSRSAWLAAGVSCLCVYAWHMDWADKFRLLWRQQRWRIVLAMIGGLCTLLLAGHLLFALKPDSARGRLFTWKITCRTIAKKPLTGYGVHNFAAAYGDAQEAYFAAGDYEPWEERVAGSPEYAFNEYLQAVVELGIPLAACLLVVVILCLYIGVRKERYGICGAILSLMIFSFSSYPLQLPAFIVTSVGLLLACIFDGSRWQWLGLAVWVGVVGGFRLKNDLRTEQACRGCCIMQVRINR